MECVVGIGIDAVDIKRVHAARRFKRLSEYILQEEERETLRASRDRFQFLASRLALKEAVIKAFPYPLNLHDVRIFGYGGKPEARITHRQADDYRVDVGLTHTFELAIGVACVVRT